MNYLYNIFDYIIIYFYYLSVKGSIDLFSHRLYCLYSHGFTLEESCLSKDKNLELLVKIFLLTIPKFCL